MDGGVQKRNNVGIIYFFGINLFGNKPTFDADSITSCGGGGGDTKISSSFSNFHSQIYRVSGEGKLRIVLENHEAAPSFPSFS